MEATKIKMNMDGTIRAKVLQYKSDGNTLIEKLETLKQYADGVYYNLTPDNYGGEYCNIVLEINGVFWKNNITPGNVFCIGHYAHKRWDNEARTVVATFPDIVRKNAKLGKYINNLQIEVMRRLGHDVADLQASHDEYIRQREERDRQRAEEAERREAERREAEERRKAELLADGKEKLMNHERIAVEQIELIAESVGYKINIRTIGFMREKVTEAVLREDDTVTVWGRKLTSRNIDGTAKVMRELYDRLKAQAEAEVAKIKPMCETTCEERPTLDDHDYYTWLMMHEEEGSYMTIADKALAEALAWIFEAAYRKGKGHIVAMNEDGVLIETVIAATPTETPQISTEAAETVNVSAEGEKEAERAENTPKRKIQYFHYTPGQLKRYIIDVYEKRANGEWVLLPYAQIDTDAGLWDVVDGKIGWWTNWRREEFSEMNMDFNSPTCGRCCKINRTYQTDNYVISNEKLLEFTLNGDYYYIQRQIYSKGGIKECYTIMDALGDFSVNDASDTLEGIMRRFDKCYKGTATIIWQASETPSEPPQSLETPRAAQSLTSTDKRTQIA